MKNNKGLIAIIIILAILVIVLGVYIFKRESIRQWVSKDVQKTTEENNTKYEEDVNKIITLGTGMKRPSQYKPSEQYYIIDNRKYELDTLVNSLKNEELKKEINTFIKESTDKLENKRNDFEKYIEEGNREREKIEFDNQKIEYYRIENEPYDKNVSLNSRESKIISDWQCINGYLSIALYYGYSYGSPYKISTDYEGAHGTYKLYCKTYDLYTGKEVQFSDLFFEGEDYGTEVYELMQSKITTEGYGNYIKREFIVLPQNYDKFTLKNIFFDRENLYFSEGVEISTDYCYTMFPVLTITREMNELFENNIQASKKNIANFRIQISQVEIEGLQYKIPKIKHWDKKVEDIINSNIEKYIEYLLRNDLLQISEKGDKNKNTVMVFQKELTLFEIYNGALYPYIEIGIDRNTGELKSVKYSDFVGELNDVDWNKILQKMKNLM